MKDDLPWMLDATARLWRFRDGRLTGYCAQRRADHAARLLRRAARPGRILKLMADKRGKRIHTITSAPRMPGGRVDHAQKNPPGGSGGERCCAVLRGSGGDVRYHHGKPDLDLFAGGVIGKAGGDQADLAYISQS